MRYSKLNAWNNALAISILLRHNTKLCTSGVIIAGLV